MNYADICLPYRFRRLEPEVLKRGPLSDLSDCNVVKTNKCMAA